MKLNDILADLSGVVKDGMTKTASAETPAVPQAQQELVEALNTALTASEPEKTAEASAAGGATVDLVKMASDLATADKEALEKEANLYGAAVADGFVARLTQYTDVVAAQPQPTEKTAAVAPAAAPTEAEFTKFAQDNPELVKQAIELGYRDTKGVIEHAKLAAAQQGYDDTVAAVKKMAESPDSETKLAELKAEIDKVAVQGTEDQEKLAAVKQGYTDTVQEIEKIAEDCYQKGYVATVELLKDVRNT